MSESTYLAMALLAMRGACHFLIALRIFSYKPTNQREHRQVVGLIAAIFGGANLAEFLRILNNFTQFAVSVEPYLPIVMLFVLIFVTWSGGNIARLLPQKLLQRLP
jgi:hypothetical protein